LWQVDKVFACYYIPSTECYQFRTGIVTRLGVWVVLCSFTQLGTLLPTNSSQRSGELEYYYAMACDGMAVSSSSYQAWTNSIA
jgi:hypothetical protein